VLTRALQREVERQAREDVEASARTRDENALRFSKAIGEGDDE
jgi:hypothetical protein